MILKHMDYISLKCLLVLKVKGRGSGETGDCPGGVQSRVGAEHGDLRGRGAIGPISGEGPVRECSKEACSV